MHIRSAEALEGANPTRVMRLTEVCHTVGAKKSTVYLWISKGTFPKPLRLGPRTVGWLTSDIAMWLDERISARKVA